VTRSAQDRLADIQTAIAKVYAYRPSLKGEHSEMAVSAISTSTKPSSKMSLPTT
jgi:hypothetical protein